MKRTWKTLLGGLMLVGLLGLPACESTTRTERPQAFTGQTDSRQSDTRAERPGPARLSVKGLHGPN